MPQTSSRKISVSSAKARIPRLQAVHTFSRMGEQRGKLCGYLKKYVATMLIYDVDHISFLGYSAERMLSHVLHDLGYLKISPFRPPLQVASAVETGSSHKSKPLLWTLTLLPPMLQSQFLSPRSLTRCIILTFQ